MALYLQLDGVDDYASASDHTSLQLTNNFKISITFAPKDLNSTQKYLLQKGATGGDSYSVIWEFVNNQVEFYSFKYTGTNPRTGSGIVLPDANKHTIVYQYDGTTFKGFLDGVEKFSLTKTFSLDITGSFPLYLGRSSAGNHVAASFYDVVIHKEGLLSAHYDMTTGTVQDQSGNGRNATLTGGTWVDDGVGGTPTVQTGAVSLTGTGTITSIGVASLNATANLLGQGKFTPSGLIVRNASANLLGAGNLTAVASVLNSPGASASLLGQGILNGTGIIIPRAVIIVTGEVSLLGSSILIANDSIWKDDILSLVQMYAGTEETVNNWTEPDIPTVLFH
jgi:hypothetical protein